MDIDAARRKQHSRQQQEQQQEPQTVQSLCQTLQPLLRSC